jgi:hypothetical protein
MLMQKGIQQNERSRQHLHQHVARCNSVSA